MAGNNSGFGLKADQAYQRRRFRVEISGTGSPAGTDKNEGKWKSVSWSGITWETDNSATTGEDTYTMTTTGLRDYGTLTLQGAITFQRDDMIQWFQDTLDGKACFRQISVTSIDSKGNDVTSMSWEDCHIEDYRMDELHSQADNRTLMETIVVRLGFSTDSNKK